MKRKRITPYHATVMEGKAINAETLLYQAANF